MREELIVKTHYIKKGNETFTILLELQKETTLKSGDFLVVEHDFSRLDFPDIQMYIDRKDDDGKEQG